MIGSPLTWLQFYSGSYSLASCWSAAQSLWVEQFRDPVPRLSVRTPNTQRAVGESSRLLISLPEVTTATLDFLALSPDPLKVKAILLVPIWRDLFQTSWLAICFHLMSMPASNCLLRTPQKKTIFTANFTSCQNFTRSVVLKAITGALHLGKLCCASTLQINAYQI